MADADKSFFVQIETEADLQKLEGYKRDLQKAEEAAKELGKSHDEFTDALKRVDTQLQSTEAKAVRYEAAIKRVKESQEGHGKFERQLYDLEEALAQVGGKARIASEGIFHFFNSARGIENLKEAFKGMAESGVLPIIGAVAAGVGALETLKHSIEEFAKAEERMAKVDSALAQKGLLSDENRSQIIELGEELQKTTKIAAGEWMPVIARLVQFGADPTNIEEYTNAVKNLAGVMGGDIQSAGHTFTRIMGGNVEFLRRYGIHVAEGETQTETLNNAMQELARVGGGQLEAQSRTLAGTFRGLKTEISDTFEAIGASVAKTGLLQSGLEFLGDILAGIRGQFHETIPSVSGLSNALDVAGKRTIDSKVAMEQFTKAIQAQKAALDDAIKSWSTHDAILKSDLDTSYKLRDIQRELAKIEIEGKQRKGEITKEEAAKQTADLEHAGKQDEIQKQIDEAELTKRASQEKEGSLEYEARRAKQVYEDSRKKEEGATGRAGVIQRRRGELSKYQQEIEEEERYLTENEAMPGERNAGSVLFKDSRAKLERLQKAAKFLADSIGPLDREGKSGPELSAADAATQSKKKKEEADAAQRALEAQQAETKRVTNEQDNKISNLKKIGQAQDALDEGKGRVKTEEGRKKDDDDAKKERDRRFREIEQDNRKRGLHPGNPNYRDPKGIGEDPSGMTSKVLDPLDEYHGAVLGAVQALGDKYRGLTQQLEMITERINDDRLV